MVNEIRIVNIKTNEAIVVNRSEGQYILDTMDWDSPSVSPETYRVPYQIGETLLGIVVGTRKPTLTGYVVADLSTEESLGLTWEQYFQRQREKIDDAQEVLDRVLSVFQDVRIEVSGYYLDARITQPVKYSSLEQENNEVMCLFQVDFECYNPLFYADKKTVQLASVNGMFRFPFITTEQSGDEYTVFGEIAQRQSVLVENKGQAPVGCIITVRALGGTVQNPKIYNVNTGDLIAFDGISLDDGDVLIIDTEKGEESAVLHDSSEGEDVSVVGYLTEGSTFLKVEQGSSLYSYEVGEGQQTLLEISLEYTEKYFNFRGM